MSERNKSISVVLITMPFFLAFLLLPAAIINALFSIIVIFFSALCGFLCYVILTENDEKSTTSLTPMVFVTTALFTSILAISAGYFSYWLVMFEPFEVVCKTPDCSTGPYGWSAALLAFMLSLLMLIVSFKMFKRHCFSKGKSAKSTKR